MKPFSDTLKIRSISLERKGVDTLQINMGKLCNQSCMHCHVGAGPGRSEIMTQDTIDHIVDFVEKSKIKVADITGGAPELNPNFKNLVSSLKNLDCHIIIRSNLTVIVEREDLSLPQFFRNNEVELICSLPCYLEENVDKMRGKGVYQKSIKSLKMLNDTGFGRGESDLLLHLVYNPGGVSLPPAQKELEKQYKKELSERFGVVFNSLFVIANIPINRYESFLKSMGKYDYYLKLLQDNFNSDVVEHLMCRTQVSVGWDGKLYDCDFNQMLDLCLKNGKPYMIGEVAVQQLIGADIRVGNHCYGCTAGSGSSCGGSLI